MGSVGTDPEDIIEALRFQHVAVSVLSPPVALRTVPLDVHGMLTRFLQFLHRKFLVPNPIFETLIFS